MEISYKQKEATKYAQCFFLPAFILAVLLFPVFTHGQFNPTFLHQAAPGDNLISCIVPDANGNVYIAGNTTDSISIGTNTLHHSGGFISKYDSLSQNQWIIPAGKYIDYPQRKMPKIAIDSNQELLVVGEFDSICNVGNATITDSLAGNTFIAKTDGTGSVLWLKKLYGSGLKIYDMSLDMNNNILLTGTFYLALIFGNDTLIPDSPEIITIKLDPGGNYLWMRMAGGLSPYVENTEAVSSDQDGNVYIAGQLRSINPVFDSITIPNPVNIASIGFIAKYDSSGNIQYAKKCGFYCYDIHSSAGGELSVVGSIVTIGLEYDTAFIPTQFGNGSTFIARIGNNGAIKWANFIDSDVSSVFAVTADLSGNSYFIGVCRDTARIYGSNDTLLLVNIKFPPDSFPYGYIFALDSTGNPFFGNMLEGDLTGLFMNDITVSNCGIYIAGTFKSLLKPFYYQNDSITNSGGYDGFVLIENACNLATTAAEFNSDAVHHTINAFPNPFHDEINIINNQNKAMEIVLVDSRMRELVKASGSGPLKLNTSALSAGLYILYSKNLSDGIILRNKLVKQ